MLYLIENDNFKLIELEISKLLDELEFPHENLIKYDLSNTSTLVLINELDTYSMFQEKKAVLAYDPVFLTTAKSEIEQNVQVFEDYINNPNPNNILILACSKLDGKKNICKLIKKNFKHVEPNIDYSKLVKDKLKSFKTNDKDIALILSLIGEDYERINNELDKLIIYKDNDLSITDEDIRKVILRKGEDNFYALMDAIVKKDKANSLIIYNDLLNLKVDPVQILINLSFQFRMIYQVKILSNMSDVELAETINSKNPKQIRAIRYKINNFSEKELLTNLHKLAILDEEIKTSKILADVALPMFIANL